ncbi:hypothetical protein [uncultured Tateyamaria sp.]|uniref:hypothetical protein n=1 Tax=uncultured Tateyamaria sp. TaxID=455651 RepID=UPI002604C48A|nr:hypothetical protein [uncultured Tateyamaria sp.]
MKAAISAIKTVTWEDSIGTSGKINAGVAIINAIKKPRKAAPDIRAITFSIPSNWPAAIRCRVLVPT